MSFTTEQMRAQYIRNAASQAREMEVARRVTNAGAGGPKGKRYKGWFFHQHVERFVQVVMSTNATAEELEPMRRVLAGAFARTA